jgi:hypothetical protein
MIAFLVIVVSIVAMDLAGKRALRPPCDPTASPPPQTLLRLELKGDVPGDSCGKTWTRSQVTADFLFIPGYSSFLAFTLLLLSVPRYTGDPPASPAWSRLGIGLAVLMAASDVAENLLIFERLDGGFPPYLWIATTAKWGAVALAVLLAGVLALKRQRGSWRWLTALIGVTGLLTGSILAVSFSLALKPFDPAFKWVQLDTTKGLPLFYMLVLVHAVVVMVKSDPGDLEPPREKGEPRT